MTAHPGTSHTDAAPKTKSPAMKGPNARRITAVNNRLRKQYGPRLWQTSDRPLVDALIATILSQATNDVNSGRAFTSLKVGFGSWEEVRGARLRQIESRIRVGGLAKMKARCIKDILQELHNRHGEVTLEHLRDAPTERVKEELGRLPRIGPKTIACVLMFALGRPDFPVDTHVHRIARRLGWVPQTTSAVLTYQTLNAAVPDPIKYELHVLLITHGRDCCRSRKPLCPGCPVRSLCPEGKQTTKDVAVAG